MSAKRTARRVPRQARQPKPQEADDIFSEDEDPDESPDVTIARARKAAKKAITKPHVVTRVAMRAAPGKRGDRNSRSANDRENNGRQQALNQRTMEFSEDEIREFMAEEDNIIPFVRDTKDWHYCYARVQLGNKDDKSNIVNKLHGKMGYEIVTGPDMLPPKTDLGAIRIKEGDFSGGYQYRDTILMRCPMRNFKLAEIAGHRRARQLDRMLDAGAQAGRIDGESRTGIVVEENIEKQGIREVEPEGEFEAA